MATLSEMRTTVAGYLSNEQLVSPTSSQIDAEINKAIGYYENKYFWFQEARASLTATVGSPTLDISSVTDFKFQKHPSGLVLLDNSFFYTLQSVSNIKFDNLTNSASNGLTRFYTYRDGGFELTPYPQEAYTIYLYYYKTYANLSADGDTNDFSTYANDLIEKRATAQCYLKYKENTEKYTIFSGEERDEFKTLKRETMNRRATGNLTTENIIEDPRQFLYFNYY